MASRRQASREVNGELFSFLEWAKNRRMSSSTSLVPQPDSSARWRFLRDVLVFELKMLLDNVRDFALMPVSLVAALIDFIFKGERHGALFYQVLRWGAQSERMIDVYSAIEGEDGSRSAINPGYTVDAVVARLEDVLVRECEKGGTAASVKAAVDQAIDQLHKGTSVPRDRARDAVTRASGRLRSAMQPDPREKDKSK